MDCSFRCVFNDNGKYVRPSGPKLLTVVRLRHDIPKIMLNRPPVLFDAGRSITFTALAFAPGIAVAVQVEG